MSPQLHLTAAVVAVFMTAWLAYNHGVTPSKDVTETSTFGVSDVWQYESMVPIDNGAVGPESFAFDPHGEGPYTGVSDGHIIKWHRHENRWVDFAVTSSSHRGDDDVDECGGPYKEHPKKEHICGRPLGLCFNIASGQLYVADAYMGLVVIEPTGGIARKVISHAVEDQPLAFTNSLDIDQRTGVVYFTSSSSKYERSSTKQESLVHNIPGSKFYPITLSSIGMRPQLHLTAAVVAVFMTAWLAYSRGVTPSKDVTETSTFGVSDVWQYENMIPIEYGAVGPESFAFDPHGEGPYTGVSDGHIIKWHRHQNRWEDFAVTSSPHRGDDDDDEECGGPYKEHPKKEHICGRPLGLCFNVASGQLYVADAYMGLVVIEPTGGVPRKVISHAVEGQPLAFTNSLDIDQRTGAVYFTSSSSKYERRNYLSLILSGDNSGRLIKYEQKSEQVNVLLNNLTFANGVALSKNGNYILISETTKCRILRYWLETPKAGTLEVFANLPGFPDNIKRSPRGGFWVGINSRREKFIEWMLKYPWIGKGLVMLPLDTKTYSYLAKVKGSTGLAIRLSEEGDVLEIFEDHRSGNRRSISEVEERDGVLWVGSVDAPFVIKYNNSCGTSIK